MDVGKKDGWMERGRDGCMYDGWIERGREQLLEHLPALDEDANIQSSSTAELSWKG